MAGNRAGKGNPASTRMSNDKLKARRARSWARGELKKVQHRLENEARAAHNKELRAAGLLTAHELKEVARREKRDAMRAAGLLPPIGTSRAVWEAEKRKKHAA